MITQIMAYLDVWIKIFDLIENWSENRGSHLIFINTTVKGVKNQVNDPLGEFIKKYQYNKGFTKDNIIHYTQVELAEHMKVTPKTIYRWIQNKMRKGQDPSPRRLEEIQTYLDKKDCIEKDLENSPLPGIGNRFVRSLIID